MSSTIRRSTGRGVSPSPLSLSVPSAVCRPWLCVAISTAHGSEVDTEFTFDNRGLVGVLVQYADKLTLSLSPPSFGAHGASQSRLTVSISPADGLAPAAVPELSDFKITTSEPAATISNINAGLHGTITAAIDVPSRAAKSEVTVAEVIPGSTDIPIAAASITLTQVHVAPERCEAMASCG